MGETVVLAKDVEGVQAGTVNERARERERHIPRISEARTLGACASANLEVLPAEVYQRLLKKIGPSNERDK